MRRFVLLWMVVMMAFVSCRGVFAATAEPDNYRITLKKVEARVVGGGYATILEGSQSFDIASADASGSVAGYFGQAVEIPDGTYDALRVTLSATINMTGTLVQDAGINTGSTFHTGCGRDNGGACVAATATDYLMTNALVAAFGGALPAGMTIDDANAEIVIVQTGVNFSVAEGQGAAYTIFFDTSTAMGIEADNTMHPEVPSFTLSRS
ncbi:MAG: hypothetical protein HQL11_03815 [Candidatus Omnitrophica bacterium]|nr:hypothetical protein [Candidatus Omnitrophota bacterium]